MVNILQIISFGQPHSTFWDYLFGLFDLFFPLPVAENEADGRMTGGEREDSSHTEIRVDPSIRLPPPQALTSLTACF